MSSDMTFRLESLATSGAGPEQDNPFSMADDGELSVIGYAGQSTTAEDVPCARQIFGLDAELTANARSPTLCSSSI